MIQEPTVNVLQRHRLRRWNQLRLNLSIYEDPTIIFERIQQCKAGAAGPPELPVGQGDAIAANTGSLPQKFPAATLGLITVLVAIFLWECWFPNPAPAKSGTPAISTLVVMGGTVNSLIWKGQIWRLFTAALLHGSFLHLLANCSALAIVGYRLERLIGWTWFLAIFAFSAVSGSLLGVALHRDNLVGVGASGGIVGLFAFTATIAMHFRQPEARTKLWTTAGQTLFPTLIPLQSSAGGMNIDYAAHFGGAAGGLLSGLLLLLIWSPDAALPPAKRLIAVVPAVFFLVCGVSFGIVFASQSRLGQELAEREAPLARSSEFSNRPAPAIMPAQRGSATNGRPWQGSSDIPKWRARDFPDDVQAAKTRSLEEIDLHPRDTLVRLAHAALLTQQGRPRDAEFDLRAALLDTETLSYYDNEADVRIALGDLLVQEGRISEAKDIALRLCRKKLRSDLERRLKAGKLCE